MKANPLLSAATPAACRRQKPPRLVYSAGSARPTAAAPAPAAEKPSLFPNAASNPFGGGSAAPAPSLFGAPGAAARVRWVRRVRRGAHLRDARGTRRRRERR